jgi:hypothetical protein
MSYPRINCDGNYPQSLATRGLEAGYLYLFLPVSKKNLYLPAPNCGNPKKRDSHNRLGSSMQPLDKESKSKPSGLANMGSSATAARQGSAINCSEGGKG